jgi:hypothetical protein
VPIDATTNSATFIEPGYGAATDLSQLNFVGKYTTATEKDYFGNAPYLHIGSITGYPAGQYNVIFRSTSTSWQKIVPVNITDVVGIIVALPAAGDYTVGLSRTTTDTVTLCVGSRSVYTVGKAELYVPTVGSCSADDGTSSGLSGGAVAGIVIGVVAGIAIIGVVVFVFFSGTLCLYLKARGAVGDSMSQPIGYTAQSGEV